MKKSVFVSTPRQEGKCKAIGSLLGYPVRYVDEKTLIGRGTGGTVKFGNGSSIKINSWNLAVDDED